MGRREKISGGGKLSLVQQGNWRFCFYFYAFAKTEEHLSRVFDSTVNCRMITRRRLCYF